MTPPPAQATLGDTVTRAASGMLMVHVHAVTFERGSTPAQIAEALDLCDPSIDGGGCPKALFDDENPQNTVTLKGSRIDQTGLTNAGYRLCLEIRSNPVNEEQPRAKIKDPRGPGEPEGLPVGF